MLIVPNSVSLRLMTLMLVASNAQISLATSAKNKKKILKSGFMYGHIFKWNYKKKDEFVQKICQRLWDF